MKPQKTIFLTLGVLPFLYWIYKCINVDLWCDEVVSLDLFVFTDFFTGPVLNYPEPNNHIMLNIIGQLISGLCGFKSLFEVANHVYVLRVFQALITLLIAYYSVRVISKNFKLGYSTIVVGVLFTTIPFINFSLQWRGYNLSALLLLMIVHYSLNYINNPNKTCKIFIIIFSAMLIYTIPSNIYMLASFILIILFYYVIKRKQKDLNMAGRYFRVAVFIFLGIAASLVFYFPIISSVLTNEYSSKKAENVFYSLRLFPTILNYFISGRYFIIPLFALGLFILVKKRQNIELVLCFFALLILPFLLSFVHQKHPFDRVFVPLAPVFVILVSVMIIQVIEKIKGNFIRIAFVCFLPVSFFWVFYQQVRENELEVSRVVLNDNHMEYQSIYQYYHLTQSFGPNKTFKENKTRLLEHTVLVYHQKDVTSINLYLKLNNIKFVQLNTKQDLYNYININDSAFVITTYKKSFMSDIASLSGVTPSILDDSHPITTLAKVVKTK